LPNLFRPLILDYYIIPPYGHVPKEKGEDKKKSVSQSSLHILYLILCARRKQRRYEAAKEKHKNFSSAQHQGRKPKTLLSRKTSKSIWKKIIAIMGQNKEIEPRKCLR